MLKLSKMEMNINCKEGWHGFEVDFNRISFPTLILKPDYITAAPKSYLTLDILKYLKPNTSVDSETRKHFNCRSSATKCYVSISVSLWKLGS